jgi:ATP/maltotriose-dependent transcriptional regulator MalT
MTDLTPRQRQIDRLVRRGLTSRKIAEKLAISQRTVEVHRGNIARRALLAGTQRKDPLEHPAVQRVLRRLSAQVTALASELKDLRVSR